MPMTLVMKSFWVIQDQIENKKDGYRQQNVRQRQK